MPTLFLKWSRKGQGYMSLNHKGYCKAYRKAWHHPIFKDLLEAAVWNFLYQNAFYEDGECFFNGVTFKLKRGQIAITSSFLAKGFRVSESTIKRLTKRLTDHNQIKIKSTNKGTIITIINYELYQGNNKTDDLSKELTNDQQPASNLRTNGYNNKEYNKNKESKEDNIYGVSDQVWNDFVKHRKSKKAPITKTAMKGFDREAKKAGLSFEEAIIISIERGWRGFKAEWIANDEVSIDKRFNNVKNLEGVYDWIME